MRAFHVIGYCSFVQRFSALHLAALLTICFTTHAFTAEVPVVVAVCPDETGNSDSGFVDFTCCGTNLAALSFAMEQASHRNGSLVPLFKELPVALSFKVSVLHGASYNTVDQLLEAHLSSGSVPAAVIGPHYSSHTYRASAFFNSRAIPAVNYASTSPVFFGSKSYPFLFRAAPNDALLVETIAGLFEKLQWTHANLLYAPDDTWSTGMALRFREIGQKKEWVVRLLRVEGSEEQQESVLWQAQRADIRAMVNFLLKRIKDAIMKLAARIGIAGADHSATGWAWFMVGVTTGPPTGRPGYKGVLSVDFSHWTPDRRAALWSTWPSAMQSRTLPGGRYFAVEDRTHVNERCSNYIGYAIDAIASLAWAAAKVAESEPNQTVVGPSSLARRLAQGVDFDSMSGQISMKAKSNYSGPWEERRGKIVLSNVISDDGVVVKELPWPFDPSVVTWPGRGLQEPPVPTVITACSKEPGRCGIHGVCSEKEEDALRPSGHCECGKGWAGRRCSVAFLPGRHPAQDKATLSDRVSPAGKTLVWVSLQVTKFKGFDQTGDFFSAEWTIKLFWVDYRPVFMTQAGRPIHYERALQEKARGLWLPDISWPNCEDGALAVKRGHLSVLPLRDAKSTLLSPDATEMELVLRMSGTCLADTNWRLFPFDSQTAAIILRAVDQDHLQFKFLREACKQGTSTPWYSMEYNNSLGGCTEKEQTALDEELSSEDAPGVPRTVLNMHRWTPSWQFTKSQLMMQSTNGQESMELHLTMKRNFNLTTIRIIIPLILLVIMSWAGFYIRITALMPRFASGFISFLALSTFKNSLFKLMPENIADTSWIDIFLSLVGFMMVFAVGESVMAQFINAHYSERISSRLDFVSRRAFPGFFFSLCILLTFLDEDISTLNFIVHILVLGFFLAGVAWAMYEVRICPQLMLTLSMTDKGGVHGAKLGPMDLICIFCAIDSKETGWLEWSHIYEWIERHCPRKVWKSFRNPEQTKERLKRALKVDFKEGTDLAGFEQKFQHALKIGLGLHKAATKYEEAFNRQASSKELDEEEAELDQENEQSVIVDKANKEIEGNHSPPPPVSAEEQILQPKFLRMSTGNEMLKKRKRRNDQNQNLRDGAVAQSSKEGCCSPATKPFPMLDPDVRA